MGKRTANRLAAIAVLAMMGCAQAQAQQRVSGHVTDEGGEPLIGVSVVEEGTSHGMTTDSNGQYALDVQPGRTLVFSYIGFETQRAVVRGSVLNIVLREDRKALDEVVVVGYGTMQRKDITSSITTVQAEDLNTGVYTDPAQLLQGKVPGLVVANTSDPNGEASISLRGASSLREGSAMEPYYVVDGVPGVSLALVSPNDIESIDVLRDATATAIYGSKAANGVIIVTTKKGSRNGRTNVSYNGYVAISSTLKTLDMMSGTQMLSYAADNNIDLSAYYDTSNPANTDWQDEVLRTGFSTNHNISINGGNQQTKYTASLSYMSKQGVVRGTGMERANARSFLQTSILHDKVDLSISLNGSVTDREKGPTGSTGQSVLDAMYYYTPLVSPRNADGSWYSNTSISQNYNPLSMIHEDEYHTKQKNLQGIAKATWHILDGLDWNLQLSYENEQYIYSNYHSSQSQLPTYSANGGTATRIAVENERKQMETYLNWDHTFAQKHKVGLMAGYSWEQSDDNDGFGLTAYNFYNDDLTYYNLSYANSIDHSGIESDYTLSTLRMISFYGRVNYSYDSKYLLQATLRRDGSSAFGENHRWGTFPSISAAWRITEEDFLKDQDVLSDLKFRIGYGVSGNSLGFDAYTALQTYGSTGSTFQYTDGNSYYGLSATHNANPDLKWERTGMFNVGFDFAFFNGRLSGTIEYYDKRTKDLIYGYTVSTSRYPYSVMYANVGEISNKGIELTVNAIPVKTRDFKWDLSVNLSHNKNVVEKLSNSTYSVDYIDLGDPDIGGYSGWTVQRLMEGKPLGQFYVLEWAGYDENGGSLFNDYDEDGNLVGTTDSPDDGDRRACGDAQPDLSFGWNNTLSYRRWSLTAAFQGVVGNKIFNATRAYYSNITLLNNGKNVLASVITDQLATDSRAQAPSDRYIEDGSYLRLSQLTIAYDFGRLGDWIQRLRLYASCNNVFTITGYDGIDPEVTLGGLTPGIDFRNTRYPRTRTFMFGVNIDF